MAAGPFFASTLRKAVAKSLGWWCTIRHDAKEIPYPSHCEAISFRWIARTCQNSCLLSLRNETENGQDHGLLQCCNQRYGCHGQSLVRYMILHQPYAFSRARRQCSVDTGNCTFIRGWLFFPTSFKVNKVLASNRGNAAVYGQFTLQDNLLGGLKHVETLLNEKDDYCRYWFIISAGFLYILHEQHGLVALHAAGSTAAIASKQCDIQQQHWRLRGLHFHRMVHDAVNRCKLHCTMNTTSPFFSIHVTFNRFQLPFPFQVVEVVFGHLNGHHHISPL